jgi:DNA-binding transcriptional regulator PaaX
MMKHSARSFIRRHPLSLQEVIATPMIVRENVPGLEGLPFPRSTIIQDLARFAGHSPGALRTALSRLRTTGELVSFADPSGVTRFRLTETQNSVSGVVRAWPERPEGFLIGVFSFRAPEEAKRRAVRETLRHFGFKRIAQNTYINGMIDTSGLEAEMKRAGVADRFYVFRCPEIDDPTLLGRLAEVFDVKNRKRTLEDFREELAAFLEEPGIDSMEIGRRVFYAGPVHHRISFAEEPPIPARILPPGYPLSELRSYLDAAITTRRSDIVRYYRALCE